MPDTVTNTCWNRLGITEDSTAGSRSISYPRKNEYKNDFPPQPMTAHGPCSSGGDDGASGSEQRHQASTYELLILVNYAVSLL